MKNKLDKIVLIKEEKVLGFIEEVIGENFIISLLEKPFLKKEVNQKEVIKINLTKLQVNKINAQVDDAIVKMLIETYASSKARKVLYKDKIKEAKDNQSVFEKEVESYKSREVNEYLREQGHDGKSNISPRMIGEINEKLFGS